MITFFYHLKPGKLFQLISLIYVIIFRGSLTPKECIPNPECLEVQSLPPFIEALVAININNSNYHKSTNQ